MESNWTGVQEETLAVSATEEIVDKAQSSSPAPKTQTQIDGRKPSKGFGPRGESLSGKKGQKACKNLSSKGTCANSSYYYWHGANCSECKVGDQCLTRHTEADGQPSKKSKKSDRKGSVASLKESVQMGCVSQDSHPRKPILRKEVKLGSNHAVRFSKGTWNHVKIRERKGPSRGVTQKCEPHERHPCANQFEERSQDETKDAPAEYHGTWRKSVCHLKKYG